MAPTPNAGEARTAALCRCALHRGGDSPCRLLDAIHGLTLDHDSQQRLGSGSAQKHAALALQTALGFLHDGLHLLVRLEIEAFGDLHVDERSEEHTSELQSQSNL